MPILKKAGIEILQIGAAGERPFPGCKYLQGKTTINQAAFIISKAKLILSADSFASHLSGHYNVPLTCLYSNNYTRNVSPYFGSPSKQILLEPPCDRKPSFSYDENPKQINRIKPEDVAKSVCKLLGLQYDFKYEFIQFGHNYLNRIVETIPSHVIDVRHLGIDALIIRADYEFNEQNIAQQLNIFPGSIVTNRPINIKLLQQYKHRIKQLVYIIDENNSHFFCQDLQRAGLNFVMISSLSEEEIKKLKIDYMDFGIIHKRAETKMDNLEKLYYVSNKFTLNKGKIYPSYASSLLDRPISSFDSVISPCIDSPEFRAELEYFALLKPV